MEITQPFILRGFFIQSDSRRFTSDLQYNTSLKSAHLMRNFNFFI